ncbi:Ku protein [Rhodoligotrophos ferricapiens]|uniref:non-homologous end joining protein Ku n=1 Tax=Rhodoligotrophos ferricapiens TaxID=3069264 RepID=UPI00315D2D52
MAPRAFWTGYLKLSLVTCRVSMVPATSENERVRFHMVNAKTGHRLVSQYVDAETGKPVEDEDYVKGYPRGEDDYVLIEDDEIEAVALESTRTIDIDMFVASSEVPWIWYDKPHYLRPDDDVSAEAFAVIRDAMAATDKVGIARLVLYRRERAVMLKPRDRGIELWTLRYGDEVRPTENYFGDLEKPHVEKTTMELVKKLIDERTTEWDPKLMSDPVQDRLLDMIEAKKKGRKRPAKARAKAASETEAPTGDNVVSIVDALKRSLEAEGKKSKR